MTHHHGRHARPAGTAPAPPPQWGHAVQVDGRAAAPPAETPARPPMPPERKKHRVFLWVFLAVQALFLAWLIPGLVTAGGTSDAATGLGATIGAGLIVGFWVAVDFILAVSYWIYRVAKKD